MPDIAEHMGTAAGVNEVRVREGVGNPLSACLRLNTAGWSPLKPVRP